MIEQRMKNNKPYLWLLHHHQFAYCIITIIAILSFSFLQKAQTNMATYPVNTI